MKINRNLVGIATTWSLAIAFSIVTVLTNDTTEKNVEYTAEQIAAQEAQAAVTLQEGQVTAGVAAVLDAYEEAATETVEQVASIEREAKHVVAAYGEDETTEQAFIMTEALYGVPVETDALYADMPAGTEALYDDMSVEAEEQELSEEEAAWQDSLMPDVKSAMNVRAEASAEAQIVGKLHKGDRATVLEQGEEWTLISSGKVEGYVKNEYCLFGSDAYEYALENCDTVATVQINGLRIRKDMSTDSGIVTTLAENDTIVVDTEEETADGWVAVKYHGETYYVSAEYVEVDLETGEALTVEEEAELKRKLASQQKPSEGIVQTAEVAANVDELTLLAAIIQCEAGNQTFEAQLAVGAVVINRVKSDRYPNTIYDVVFQKSQFGPASNGALARRLNKGVGQTSLQAAQAALEGYDNTGGALHFKLAKSGRAGTVIGPHVFY